VDIYAPHSHGFAAADGEVRGGRDCFGLFERLEHAGIKCTSQTSEGPAEPAVVVPWFQHVEVITASELPFSALIVCVRPIKV
jgi:hypothetical protein